MLKIQIWVGVFLLCLLVACQKTKQSPQNPKGTETRREGNSVSVVHRRKLVQEFDLNKEGLRFLLHSISRPNGNLEAVYLDKSAQRIEMYNLETRKLEDSFSIQFSVDSLDGALRRLYVQNRDSIFYLQSTAISLANAQGQLLRKITINQDAPQGASPRRKYIDDMNQYKMLYKQGKLYLHQYCSACRPNTPEYYEVAHEWVFDFHTNQSKELPVYYPKAYSKASYGFLQEAERIGQEDRQTYSFRAVPDFCVYLLEKDSFFCAEQVSAYQKEPSRRLTKKQTEDSQYKLTLLALDNWYEPPIYDAQRRCYYRIFHPAQPEKNEEGFFNQFSDRESVLMLYNEDLELLAETVLEKRESSEYWYEAQARNARVYVPIDITEQKKQKIYVEVFEITSN